MPAARKTRPAVPFRDGLMVRTPRWGSLAIRLLKARSGEVLLDDGGKSCWVLPEGPWPAEEGAPENR